MKKAVLFILAAAIVTMILVMCGGSLVTASGKEDAKQNDQVQAEVSQEALEALYEEALETKDEMAEVKAFFAKKAWYQEMPEEEQKTADLGVLEAIDWFDEMGIR